MPTCVNDVPRVDPAEGADQRSEGGRKVGRGCELQLTLAGAFVNGCTLVVKPKAPVLVPSTVTAWFQRVPSPRPFHLEV